MRLVILTVATRGTVLLWPPSCTPDGKMRLLRTERDESVICGEQDEVFSLCHTEQQAVEGIRVSLRGRYSGQAVLVSYGEDDGSG